MPIIYDIDDSEPNDFQYEYEKYLDNLDAEAEFKHLLDDNLES